MLNKNVQAKEESECLVEEEENVCRIWFERILVLFSLESSVLRDLDVTIFCYEIIFYLKEIRQTDHETVFVEASLNLLFFAPKIKKKLEPRSNKQLKPNTFSTEKTSLHLKRDKLRFIN